MEEANKKESNKSKWGHDVTDLLKQFVSMELNDMQPMLHNHNFSLMDSMSAIELMDPKMDQFCASSSSIPISSLDEILASPWEHYSNPISPRLAVRLLQALVVLEVSFVDGSSVLETICQCIFCWKQGWQHFNRFAGGDSSLNASDALVEGAISIYCRCLVKSSGHIFSAVLSADIYEDEDFAPSYRSYLCDNVLDSSELLAAIDPCIASLESQAEQSGDEWWGMLASLLRYRRAALRLFQCVDEWVDKVTRIVAAIRSKHLFGAVSQTEQSDGKSNESGKDAAESEPDLTYKKSAELATEFDGLVERAVAANAAISDLQNWLSKSTDFAAFEKFTTIDQPEIQFAFRPQLVRMIHTGLARAPSLRSFADSLQFLGSLCSQISNGVCEISHGQGCLKSIQRGEQHSPITTDDETINFEELLWATVRVTSQRMQLLPRCVLSALLSLTCRGGTGHSLSAMLQKSMLQSGVPSSLVNWAVVSEQWLPANPTFAAWEALRWLCGNRDKMFARAENMLSNWGVLCSECFIVDEQFKAVNGLEGDSNHQWCCVWSVVLVTLFMDVYMSMMVEMDLLETNELDYFYWYWDYVLSIHVWANSKLKESKYALEVEMYRQRQQQQALIEDTKNLTIDGGAASSGGTGGGKSKKKKAKKPASEAVQSKPLAEEEKMPEKDPMSATESLVRGRALLCKGLFRSLCLLSGSSAPWSAPPDSLSSLLSQIPVLVDKSEGRYSSWTSRYELRFKPLRSAAHGNVGTSTIPTISHDDFITTMIKIQSPSENLLQSAAQYGKVDLIGDLLVQEMCQGAAICFQTAKKVFDDARKLRAAAAAASASSESASKGPPTAGSSDNLSFGGSITALSAAIPAPKQVDAALLNLTKMSVASSIATTKIEKLLLRLSWKSASEGNAAGSKRLKLQLNRKYNSLYPVLEVEEEST